MNGKISFKMGVNFAAPFHMARIFEIYFMTELQTMLRNSHGMRDNRLYL